MYVYILYVYNFFIDFGYCYQGSYIMDKYSSIL